jgi:hypothetical protein
VREGDVSLRLVAFALTLALVSALGPTSALAESLIRPGQHFVGLVNGAHDNAVVYVACAGPIVPDRRTHPLRGQTMSVAHVRAGGGSTGSTGTRIVARFLDDKSVAVKFRSYGLQQELPTSILVPCEGKGVVRSPRSRVRQPRLPTSSRWRT